MRQLALELGERSYNIYIEAGVFNSSELLQSYCEGENVLLLSNETIGPLYINQLASNFVNKKVFQFLIPDGESYKTLEYYAQVLDFLIANGFRRNDTLIALGGGVVGDLGGFVAASYQRGMGFIQAPTSLLAQVDSSVGGKTAVNHALGKNMIGAFYQPKAVFIDINTLASLPKREYCSGFAEVVKYAMLGAVEIKDLLLASASEIMKRDREVLAKIIYYSCQKKAQIVSKDETEQGSRALLNLGHTFGHALEKITDYKEYLHGEAISIGMVMAINLSLAKGFINIDTAEIYRKMLRRLKLPETAKVSEPIDAFIKAMKLDKKNLSEVGRFVLPKGDRCVVVEVQESELIKQAIEKQLS